MSRTIAIYPQVEKDVQGIYRYIAANDRDRAITFFDAVRETFADLARMPGLGQVYESGENDLVNLHRWFVKGFKTYLIFYLFDDVSITIVRVIDGRRDLTEILNEL
ncbi:MAG: hypothetical protein B0A82_03275 [Alkalinema sp. CACIAM 70d]|nr:MAG: hypothetical protein B0A82_03275 [Alkalinema sp. CACIAM 70d]